MQENSKKYENMNFQTPSKKDSDRPLIKSSTKIREGYMFTSKSKKPVSFRKNQQSSRKHKAIIEVTKNLTYKIEDLPERSNIFLGPSEFDEEDKQIEKIIERCLEKREVLKQKLIKAKFQQESIRKLKEQISLTQNLNQENKKLIFEHISWKDKQMNYLYEEKMSHYNEEQALNKIATERQRKIYKLVSLEQRLRYETTNIEKQLEEEERRSNQLIQKIKDMKEQKEKQENLKVFYRQELKELSEELDDDKKQLEEEQFIYSIAKLQIYPEIRIGFMYTMQGVAKELIFERHVWNKQFQIKLTENDLKYYLRIQLYKKWQKIIKKYNPEQNRQELDVLLGEKKNEEIANKISNQLKSEIQIKKQNIEKLIFYACEIDSKREEFKARVTKIFEQFDNGIIKVKKVEFIKKNKEGDEKIILTYDYLQSQNQVEYFTLLIRKRVTKDQIFRYFRSAQKRILLFVEIPLLCTKNEMTIYEELYKVMKRKGNK